MIPQWFWLRLLGERSQNQEQQHVSRQSTPATTPRSSVTLPGLSRQLWYLPFQCLQSLVNTLPQKTSLSPLQACVSTALCSMICYKQLNVKYRYVREDSPIYQRTPVLEQIWAQGQGVSKYSWRRVSKELQT